jgi:putative ABC transport system permease protein
MIAVLARVSYRSLLRHPWQVLLAALGVALGVAVVTAVDLTKASARQSLADATASIVGRTTHQIVGGPRGLDEALYAKLRRSGVVREIAPVIEASTRLLDHQRQSLRLLGVDPIAEAPFRGYWARIQGGSIDASRLITQPGTALVSRAMLDRLGVPLGGKLRIAHAGQAAVLEIIGVLDPHGQHPALAGTELAVVDIATAQEALGMIGRLSRIDAILESPRQAAQLRHLLGVNAELIPSAAQTEAVAEMTAAFHANLTALSLLALLVGLFLIYNSQTFLVVQRRGQFGILRALGLRRRQLALLIGMEAVALGLVGALAGLVMGVVLAQGLVGLVGQTINDLYYTLSLGAVTVDFSSLGKGVLLGVGGSACAAAFPAREAMQVAPRAAMSRADLEKRVSGSVRWAFQGGLVSLGLGAGLLLLPSKAIEVGLTSLFLIVMSFALMSPALTVALVGALLRMGIVRKSIALRLAVRGVTASLSRTGVAVAALMLAVSHVIGVGLMVGSFRSSVVDWLTMALQAEYYISVPGDRGSEAGTGLSKAMLPAIAAIEGVNGLSHVRYTSVVSARGIDAVTVYQLNERARKGFRFRENPQPATLWQRFEQEQAVLVSESYAFHRAVEPGDVVSLRTDSGYRDFLVAAIYQNYASDRGTIAMSRTTYDRYWNDPALSGIGVYAGPRFDPDKLRHLLPKIMGSEARAEVVSNHRILEESLWVFDRTFTITKVLQWLAGIIAFVGVFSALLAVQLERARELGILKAIGVTPRQIYGVVVGETALIGGAAGLLAVPVGILLGVLLVAVINRRAFGWTMALELDLGVVCAGFLTALAAALIAGIYPAARMAGAQPAQVLRQE